MPHTDTTGPVSGGESTLSIGQRMGSPHYIEATRNRIIEAVGTACAGHDIHVDGHGVVSMDFDRWARLKPAIDAVLEEAITTASGAILKRAALASAPPAPSTAEGETAPLRNVGVVGPVDGMNERHPAGSYVRLVLTRHDIREVRMISRGAAEVLAAEIDSLLNPPNSHSPSPVPGPAGDLAGQGEMKPGQAPGDGQRVTLSGVVAGRCSISPPPWISIRLDGGRVIALDAPFTCLRVDPPAPRPAGDHSRDICIGWPTIKRLAVEGAVVFKDAGVGLAAASDLFGMDIDGLLDRPSAPPTEPAQYHEEQVASIRAMLLAGQGDDDGPQILPDLTPDMSAAEMVEECLHLLERRRDVIAGRAPPAPELDPVTVAVITSGLCKITEVDASKAAPAPRPAGDLAGLSERASALRIFLTRHLNDRALYEFDEIVRLALTPAAPRPEVTEEEIARAIMRARGTPDDLIEAHKRRASAGWRDAVRDAEAVLRLLVFHDADRGGKEGAR